MRVIILILVLLGSYTHAQETENDIQIFPGGSQTFDETAGGHLLVEFKYGWLSVNNFQKLTSNEQDAVVVAVRDTVVLSLHSMNQHRLEDCVKSMTQEELEAIRGTALEMEPTDKRFNNSVVNGIAFLSMQLCSVQQRPQSKPEPEPEPEPEGPI